MLTELYEIKQDLELRVAERTAEAVQTEKRLRAFIDYSPAHIYLKDRDSRVLIINKAYEKAFEFVKRQLEE